MSIKGIIVDGQEYLYNYPDLDNKPELTPEAIGAASQEDFDALEEKVSQQNTDLLNAFPTDTVSGSIVAFPDGADELPIKAATIRVAPVQAGSGDPSPENVRPISGWMGANVEQRGKNLFFAPTNLDGTTKGLTISHTTDKLIISGTATETASKNTGTAWNNAIYGPFPAGTYTVIANGLIGQTTVDRIAFGAKDEDGTEYPPGGVRISGSIGQIANGIGKSFTFTSTKPFKCYISITIDSGSTINSEVTFQMEPGSALGEYEPYRGRTYPVTFPTTAGTVYGAEYDPVAKRLTVTKRLYNCANISGWNRDLAAQRIYRVITEIEPSASNSSIDDWLICNRFKTIPQTDIYAYNVEGIAISTGSAIQFHINGLTDNPNLTEPMVNEYFSNNQTLFVAKLATPIVYENVEIADITTYLGNNTFWADCGDIDLTYRADPTEYINKKLAEIQALVLENNG